MLTKQIIQRTLRVPIPATVRSGDSSTVARQLDSALMSVGFKLSGELLATLSAVEPGLALDLSIDVLANVRELVGDHVQHNVYFRDFPLNVPDTQEFWLSLLRELVFVDGEPHVSDDRLRTLLDTGTISLLDLPGYGEYQHTYKEMVAAHDTFVTSAKDRITTLHQGGTLHEEAAALYLSLAGSTIPLSDTDRELLSTLASWCLDGPQPETIPIRENRALINRVRLMADQPLLVDTVTDVLRLACALSGGDVTLQTPTKFVSLPRDVRDKLMKALSDIRGPERGAGKLTDVRPYREQWKRLGERLHPHEFKGYPAAQDVFAVARGDLAAPPTSLQRAEAAFANDSVLAGTRWLARTPGLLARNLDRILRMPGGQDEDVLAQIDTALTDVSGRVLLSLREHLLNRTEAQHARIFANRKGRAWVTPDTRPPLDQHLLDQVNYLLDEHLLGRLPAYQDLRTNTDILDVALPLSNKTLANGFRVLPRGSSSIVTSERLRFFMYWRQQRVTTDLDLSALFLDENFQTVGQISFTDTRSPFAVHSGDITRAPHGASEFIDVNLKELTTGSHYLQASSVRYIVPQVNVYSGEGFAETAESFFGFMERESGQRGLPFEPRTVRTRSDLRGAGQVALPVVFARTEDGQWRAIWTHLYLRGMAAMNRTETNRLSTALLARSIVTRRYLKVNYLTTLLSRGMLRQPDREFTGAAYIGLERPEEDLPTGTEVFTLDRLHELIPE